MLTLGWGIANQKWRDRSLVDQRPTTMADSGVDTEKIARLAKMAEAARLGGKGSRSRHSPPDNQAQ